MCNKPKISASLNGDASCSFMFSDLEMVPPFVFMLHQPEPLRNDQFLTKLADCGAPPLSQQSLPLPRPCLAPCQAPLGVEALQGELRGLPEWCSEAQWPSPVGPKRGFPLEDPQTGRFIVEDPVQVDDFRGMTQETSI